MSLATWCGVRNCKGVEGFFLVGLVGEMSNLKCTAENLDGVGAVDDGRGGGAGDCLVKLKLKPLALDKGAPNTLGDGRGGGGCLAKLK